MKWEMTCSFLQNVRTNNEYICQEMSINLFYALLDHTILNLTLTPHCSTHLWW